jgi:predicted amidohydrolase YtcJ
MRHLALAAIVLLLSVGCFPQARIPVNPHAGEASGALVDALIWTGDPSHPWAEAIAWNGERIVAVGSEAEVVGMLAAGTTPIDAHGTMAVPGFIDAHLHFVGGGTMLASVRLQKARSREELVAAIASYSHSVPPGAWITGGGWDHTQWGGDLPDRSWIDEITPDTPVWIERVDGHMALANSAALRAAGVTRDTPDVPGGTIVRDAAGEPTGLLKDNALALVGSAVPAATPAMNDRALEAAMSYVAANGVTSVTSMGSWDDLVTFERARDRGKLRTRVNAVVPLESWERLKAYVKQHGRGDAWVTVGGLKGFADGSLGARTASMLAPFSDALGGTGLEVTSAEDLYARVKGADTAGLAVMIHAIGDRANRTVLDVYQRVASEDGARDRRFRIEHAQHIAP